MTSDKRIHGRAMLVRLSISLWTARKFDRKASKEFNVTHYAKEDAGRYNKHLFGGKETSKVHAGVVASAGAARVAHYSGTLPWADEGWRLLPTANYQEYTGTLRIHRGNFDLSVSEFLSAYPNLRHDARSILGDLYREEDYPSPSDLPDRFSFSVEFAPVPQTGDFRLDLPADLVKEIESATESRVTSAIDVAMTGAWDRLREVVSRAADKLREPNAIFRDSLLGNVQETIDILSRLNVTGDSEFEAMRVRVAEELARLSPADLRTDKELRADTVSRADVILAAMSGVYGSADNGKESQS